MVVEPKSSYKLVFGWALLLFSYDGGGLNAEVLDLGMYPATRETC